MFRFGCLLISMIVLASSVFAAPAQCAFGQAILSAADGRSIASFGVEIADDDDERALGLMNRESMPRSSGMLFVYSIEQPVAFWMRNTLIPLDMIFIDGTGRVVSVHDRAVPRDETPISSGVPVQFVLEINGGLARRLGIAPGAILSHPAVAPGRALRPCA